MDVVAPVTAYISLGANLGDPAAMLGVAMEALDRLPQSRVAQRSSLYRSAPLDTYGPDFVNAVVTLVTSLAPAQLLFELQRIEAEQGRERPWRNAPRTLDLDLLLYGDRTSSDPRLTLPHPRMYSRAFVLLPLAEIAPRLVSAAQLQAVGDQRIDKLESSAPARR